MSDFNYDWHRAINQFNEGRWRDDTYASWMYRAKEASAEVTRLSNLLKLEREGGLPKIHHQCSLDQQGTPVPDNHLSCCLGKECRKCEFLMALNATEDATPEQLDTIKAWTCVTHILTECGKNESHIDTSEGFLLTTDDKLYWQNVYTSLAGVDSDV